MRISNILALLPFLQDLLFVEGLNGWEILATAPKNVSFPPQQWEVLEGKTDKKVTWEIIDANSTSKQFVRVRRVGIYSKTTNQSTSTDSET